MDGETILKVTKVLIGNVDAIGSTHIDEKCFDNLEKQIRVVWGLLDEIMDESQKKDRVEYSMKKSGEQSQKFLEELYKELEWYMQEEE